MLTHAQTGKRLSKPHIDLLRGNVVPGRRSIDVTPAELTSMLDEIEYYRAEVLDVPDLESRTRTTPSAESALIQYKAMIEANTADLPDLEEGALWVYPLALGFFLGLGLTLETARHLALRV